MNDRIVVDSKICHGKPILRGTRVAVTILVGGIAGGMSMADLEREYGVSPDDVRVALDYTNTLVEQAQHHPLPQRN